MMNHWDAAMSKLNTKSELSFLSQLWKCPNILVAPCSAVSNFSLACSSSFFNFMKSHAHNYTQKPFIHFAGFTVFPT